VVLALLVGAGTASAVALRVTADQPSSTQSPTARKPAPPSPAHQQWLERDVYYLTTPDERAAFKALGDAAERDRFIEAFWLKRDPTPGTAENEVRDEHYRRLKEADERFSSGVAGWRTDRGRIWITWGPPDFVETNPAGFRGAVLGQLSEAPELPSETWTYQHLPRKYGSGQVQIVFIDYGGGDWRILSDPNDANMAYAYRLNTAANPLLYDAITNPDTGLKYTDRTAETARSAVLGPDKSLSASANAFERIQVTADLQRTEGEILAEIERSQRARGLEQDVRTQFFARRLPLAISLSAFDSGAPQAYVPLAVAIDGAAIQFERGARYRASLDVRVEVKDRASGKPVRQIAETLEFNLTEATWQQGRANGFSYHKGLELPPGDYDVQVAVKDARASALGLADARLTVPGRSEGLSIRGLMLAESATPATETRAATPFTLAGLDVRPRPDARFGSSDRAFVVFQVAGVTTGPSEAPRVSVDFTILRGQDVVLRTDPRPVEGTVASADAPRTSLVVAQPLDVGRLAPGEYILQVKAIDQRAGRYAVARTAFTVTK
jgi:GWxTD domain-containing protein